MTDNKGLVWIPPCGRTVAKHPQEAGYRCFGGRSWQSRASIGSLAGCYNSVLRKKGAAGAGHWEFSDGDPCQRPRAMVSLGTTQPHGQDRSRSRKTAPTVAQACPIAGPLPPADQVAYKCS